MESSLDRAIADPSKIDDIINKVDRYPLIAFDCETTSLHFTTGKLHGVSLATQDSEWYIYGDALAPFLPKLVQLSKDRTKSWIAWNAPFDIHWLIPYGFNPDNLIDAMVAAWMVDENQELGLKPRATTILALPQQPPDFKDLQREIKRERKLKRMSDVTVENIPLERLLPYAVKDARLTFDVWPILKNDLKREGMYDRFFKTEMPFIRLLERMERRGMCIDQARLDELEEYLSGIVTDLSKKWEELSNGANPNSPQQVGKYLYGTLKHKITKRTKHHQPSVDALSLKRLLRRDGNGAVKTLLDLRSTSKLLSTYVLGLRNQLYNGRVYGGLNRTGTVTGRISSDHPNLQNIPTRTELGKKIRAVFMATYGFDMLDADYSAVELRIAAHWSRDPRLVKIFLEGLDPHQITADLIGISRFFAKTINYLRFYGGGPGVMADNIEKDTGERPAYGDVKYWMRRWDEVFCGITAWSADVIDKARQTGYVTTIGGRKRRLPEINSPINGIQARAERQAPNAIIQGSAADILEDAMLAIVPYIDWMGGHMLLQVHDEVVIEAPKDVASTMAHYVKEGMEEIGIKYGLKVPLIAEPGIGPNWADAKH